MAPPILDSRWLLRRTVYELHSDITEAQPWWSGGCQSHRQANGYPINAGFQKFALPSETFNARFEPSISVDSFSAIILNLADVA